MPKFTNSLQPAAPGTTNDVLTLTGASGRRAELVEIMVGGMGTSTGANELGLCRPLSLGATPTVQVSQKVDPDSGSASATVATAWATQPSLGPSPVLMHRMACNSNGALNRWVVNSGDGFIVRGDSLTSHSQISLRFTTGGAGPMSVFLRFEEF